jgi:ankyrin repeat protein
VGLANFFDHETGTAPLHLAASRGDLAVVQFLLDNSARVDAQDKDGKTALIMAASKGYRDMV